MKNKYQILSALVFLMSSFASLAQTGIDIKNDTDGALVWTVAPNPADNFTLITINSEVVTPLKVVDALGKTIISEMITNGSRSLDVSDLKNGVYFILIESERKTINRKLIVRH
jgi:hypothetical protein